MDGERGAANESREPFSEFPMKMYQGDDAVFLTACEITGTKATHRQWRKWVNSRGTAFSARREAVVKVAEKLAEK